jgi:hypothetical protein
MLVEHERAQTVSSLSETGGADRIRRLRVACHDAPQVPDLSKMEGGVGAQVQQETTGRHGHAGMPLKGDVEVGGIQHRQHVANRRDCAVQLGSDLVAGSASPAELAVAITLIRQVAKSAADEVSDIPRDVKGQISSGVGDPWLGRPDLLIIREPRDFALQAFQVTQQNDANVIE